MRLFGLIGQPLTHSFSASYFAEKFDRENRSDCNYQLFPLEKIEEFPALLASHPSLIGLNVTIPYKEVVLPYLTASCLPAGLDACNCIYINKGKCEGYNTDYIGFEKSLLPLLQPRIQAAMIFGNGGAAKAVRYVLKKIGIPYTVVGRTETPGIDKAFYSLTASDIQAHQLLINTTPLGTYPAITGYPPIPYEAVGAGHILYDLVYNPSITAFLKAGEERGARIKNGVELLQIQAEESWKIWNQTDKR
ncbi:MAG: shikimate dehydrogenase [Bacteroidetes bacterium]|nr:shikimate dehydrogenase [Bacteroidota bacterium]